MAACLPPALNARLSDGQKPSRPFLLSRPSLRSQPSLPSRPRRLPLWQPTLAAALLAATLGSGALAKSSAPSRPAQTTPSPEATKAPNAPEAPETPAAIETPEAIEQLQTQVRELIGRMALAFVEECGISAPALAQFEAGIKRQLSTLPLDQLANVSARFELELSAQPSSNPLLAGALSLEIKGNAILESIAGACRSALPQISPADRKRVEPTCRNVAKALAP